MSLQEMEQQANKLIEQGETEPAVQQIYDLIVAWAQEKDFTKANAWRDKLMELDPMALTEIVDSAEIIEAEMTTTIDDDHQTIWRKLYDSLTTEEANSFYMKLKQREFPPGKVLIQQGKINNTLFFTDHGQLKIIFSQEGKEVFLKKLDSGDTVGQDTFFPISACTTSVITVSPVKVRYLDRSDMEKIEKEFPGFSKKLEEYCSLFDSENIEAILKNKTLERRQLKRYKLEGKITSKILDQKGKPMGLSFNGWITDISVGGSSFTIQSSNDSVGRTLLGRTASLTIRIDKGPKIQVEGLIVGAKFDHFSAYAIHLRFTKPFSEESLDKLIDPSPTTPSIGS